MSTNASVLRHPDHFIYEAVRNATTGHEVSVVFRPLIAGAPAFALKPPLPAFDVATKDSAIFLDGSECSSIQIISVAIQIPGTKGEINFIRNLVELHDQLQSAAAPNDPESAKKVLAIYSSLLNGLGARGSSATASSEELVESHLRPIQQLEALHRTILADLTSYRRDSDAETSALRSKLEKEAQRQLGSKLADTQKEYDEKFSDLQQKHERLNAEVRAREEALEKRAEYINDVDAKSARRTIRTDLSEKLSARSETFQLTAGTVGLRSNIRLVAGLGAVFFAAIETLLLFVPQVGPGDPVARSIAQSFAGIGFAATLVFLIRWENRWFQQHADEEFYLKRLEVDFDRASWLVEMSLEYVKERGADLPPEMLSKLSRGLFDREQGETAALHPADQLASALLGSSAEAQVQLANGSSLRFDRKGVRQLQRLPAEAPPEDGAAP